MCVNANGAPFIFSGTKLAALAYEGCRISRVLPDVFRHLPIGHGDNFRAFIRLGCRGTCRVDFDMENSCAVGSFNDLPAFFRAHPGIELDFFVCASMCSLSNSTYGLSFRTSSDGVNKLSLKVVCGHFLARLRKKS